jgi:hypothetical protein
MARNLKSEDAGIRHSIWNLAAQIPVQYQDPFRPIFSMWAFLKKNARLNYGVS